METERKGSLLEEAMRAKEAERAEEERLTPGGCLLGLLILPFWLACKAIGFVWKVLLCVVFGIVQFVVMCFIFRKR